MSENKDWIEKEGSLELCTFKIHMSDVEKMFGKLDFYNNNRSHLISDKFEPKIKIQAWYNGGLDYNLDLVFSVVMEDMKDYQFKRADGFNRDLYLVEKESENKE